MIGTHAFKGCKSLREVILPKSLTNIGEEAFADCLALETVVFNKREHNFAYQEIGIGAFGNCRSLKTVALMSPLTRVSKTDTFPGCEQYMVLGPFGADFAQKMNPGHFRFLELSEIEDLEEKLTGSRTVSVYMDSEESYDQIPDVDDILLVNHPNAVVGRKKKNIIFLPEEIEYMPAKLTVRNVKPYSSGWHVTFEVSPADENSQESCRLPANM